MRIMTSTGALLLGLAVASCSATPGDRVTSGSTVQTADGCGRVDAAAKVSTVFFSAMGDMARDCADGDPIACNPGNYALAAIAGVVFVPFGFLVGLSSPTAEANVCASQAAARLR